MYLSSQCQPPPFLETLTEHELVQHIRSATHVYGHIFDVVITREDSLILFETPLVQDPNLCDKKGNPSGDHFVKLGLYKIPVYSGFGLDRFHCIK
jgi:hypothetical protein